MAEANAFHKTTWSKVEAGDVVLIAWERFRGIVEVAITEVEAKQANYVELEQRVVVSFDFCGQRFPRWAFDPEAVVYVRSRI